jgi:hypothetical protein
MRVPRVPMRRVRAIEKASAALRRTFKLGLFTGIGLLLLASVTPGRIQARHPANPPHSRVNAVAEVVMAVACAAMSLSCLLEGYISARGFAGSIRLVVSAALAHGLGAAILGSCAAMLALQAIRDWLTP